MNKSDLVSAIEFLISNQSASQFILCGCFKFYYSLVLCEIFVNTF